jgi:hypothetical protein
MMVTSKKGALQWNWRMKFNVHADETLITNILSDRATRSRIKDSSCRYSELIICENKKHTRISCAWKMKENPYDYLCYYEQQEPRQTCACYLRKAQVPNSHVPYAVSTYCKYSRLVLLTHTLKYSIPRPYQYLLLCGTMIIDTLKVAKQKQHKVVLCTNNYLTVWNSTYRHRWLTTRTRTVINQINQCITLEGVTDDTLFHYNTLISSGRICLTRPCLVFIRKYPSELCAKLKLSSWREIQPRRQKSQDRTIQDGLLYYRGTALYVPLTRLQRMVRNCMNKSKKTYTQGQYTIRWNMILSCNIMKL